MFVWGACRAGRLARGAQAGPPCAAQNWAASVEPLSAVVEDCGRVHKSVVNNEYRKAQQQNSAKTGQYPPVSF